MLQFGERLRALRESAGLTQEELAERAGLTAKGIAALERGRRQRPYPQTIRALANALCLSEEEWRELAGSVPSRSVPPASPEAVHTSLPVPPTALIGREREVIEVASLLGERGVRLVTLTGPGGVGKSRLSLEVASTLASRFADGVLFVPLAPVRDPAFVPLAIAQALGATEVGNSSPSEMLAQALKNRRLLLLLDNFEQILSAASAIANLLASFPHLKVLVTSRAPLRIRAEREYPVQPLSLPDLSRMPALDDVVTTSAAQLFVERAQASVPSFTITQANYTAIAAICRRLDGLPLALELAAARVRLLSPTDLLARLDHSLAVLRGGSRDLPERQQTLQAAIDWSYNLLAPGEQAIFRRLAVFAGGSTLNAAEAVANAGNDEIDVLTTLTTLSEHHLIQPATRADGTIRFGMLETVRQYALARLRESGEEAAARQVHVEFFLTMARRKVPGLWSADVLSVIDELETDHDNFRAALRWSYNNGEMEIGARLAGTLHTFWWAVSNYLEGRRWLDEAIARRDELSTPTYARVLVGAGGLALRQAEFDPAREWLAEGLRLYREIGDTRGIAFALYHLGRAYRFMGRSPEAIQFFEESIDYFEQAGEPALIPAVLAQLGDLRQLEEDTEQARTLLEEAYRRALVVGHPPMLGLAIKDLGIFYRERGEFERARECFLELLELEWTRHDAVSLAEALVSLGRLLLDLGRYQRAAHFYGAADGIIGRSGHELLRSRFSDYDVTLASIRNSLGDEAFSAAWECGRSLALDEIIDEAIEAASQPISVA